MKIKRFAGKLSKLLILPVLVACVLLTQQGCLKEVVPDNYYTFTGETVADFLSNREESFSDFIYVLKKADIWGEMKTYGNYTCFAPTNDAFEAFYKEKSNLKVNKDAGKTYSSVTDLSKEECDTVAFTHIIRSLFYCKDLIDGALPYPNIMDRYLVYTTDSARNEDDTTKIKVVYRLNGKSTIIERDDSVQNGVVQIIDKVLSPSNSTLPNVMALDPSIKLFNEALVATGMIDSLTIYMDATYRSPSYDSITYGAKTGVKYHTGLEDDTGIFPEHRYFKFTAFVETDSLFNAKNIYTLEDLRNYITPILVESCGADPNAPDTDRRNPLNMFVSYHLLPEQLFYDQFNISQPEFTDGYTHWDAIDIEDYYETMQPHTLMRISYPKTGGHYINRKGAPRAENGKGVEVRGVRIYDPAEDIIMKSKFKDQADASSAINGVYHYIDDILIYDKKTREETLNVRIRIMCNTMSPDFINSGARGRASTDVNGNYTVGFLKGFCKNVVRSDETELWVRYRNNSFTCFFGDEMTIMGVYDVTFRLPPVPTAGTYELRFYYCAMETDQFNSDRGVVQFYLNGDPCGIPVDLRINQTNPKVTGDGKVVNEDDDPDYIRQKEKAMHSRGYMLGMDSYTTQRGGGVNLCWGREDCLRKIVTTDYFYPDKDYFFRIRLLTDNGCCPFNCIELVPKSIFAGDIPEDRH
ncbi:MAG: fasciclin domain-containing protein [Bacteroidaceae bacterium]|nr:fasciclin domain-containing protein [Bacteroidaceae bacterium]